MVEPAPRRRRRVAAPVGRVLTTGMSASVMFGLVAVMGAGAEAADGGVVEDPGGGVTVAPGADASGSDPSGAPAPTTTRRKVYVIEHLPADAPLPDGSAPGSDPTPGAAEIADGAPASATGAQAPLGLARSRTRRS